MDQSFWYGKRPTGVSDHIDLNQYENITEFLDETTKKYHDKTAFTSFNQTFSFAEVDNLSRCFASYLQHHTSVKPGDRIAVQLLNVAQTPIVIYGILKAGCIVVNINPLYTVREMKAQFEDAGVKALVFMDLFGQNIQNLIEQLPIEHLIVSQIAELLPWPKHTLIQGYTKYIKRAVPKTTYPAVSLRKALQLGAQTTFKKVPRQPNDIAFLQYTGGTTGTPKGAMLTHRNILANTLQGYQLFSQTNPQGEPYLYLGQESIITALPLFHIYALTSHLFMFFGIGANNILIPNPRDTKQFIQILKKNPATVLIGINTLFASLINHTTFRSEYLKELRVTISGGTALTSKVAQQWQEQTGSSIAEGYGLTECSPVVTLTPLGKQQQPGSVGLPLPDTEIKIIDVTSKKELDHGKRGELCVKGPQVMSGYWQNKAATDAILDHEGWLHTGDIASISTDGFVRIIDRLKDMIIVSGFNVYPNEIEEIVSRHPHISSCAAIGVPDEKTGEAIKLFVVSPLKDLSIEQIKNYCKERLTAYKIPRYIEIRETLPETTVGKVMRKNLREDEHKESA